MTTPPVSETPLPFGARLAQAVRTLGAPLALGLDPHLPLLPAVLRAQFEGRSGAAGRAAAAAAVRTFSLGALEAVAGRCAAVKVQSAFYEQLGSAGVAALEDTCAAARALGLLVIFDAKRGDIDTTAQAYARATIDPDGPMAADAVTLSPWMGVDTLRPFLAFCASAGRGIFVLARTTNPGSALLQRHGEPPATHHLLASLLAEVDPRTLSPEGLHAVGLVVGAGVGEEAQRLRAAAPGSWFLVPGLGAQGGTLSGALAGMRPDGLGSLPVASRSVLFGEKGTPDPGEAWQAAIAQRAQTLLAEARLVWSAGLASSTMQAKNG